MKIVLATSNADKVKEITGMLSGLDLEIMLLKDFPEVPDIVEDGATLEENAVKKASVVAGSTGISALADDSGLEVDVLDGAPGVFSSRYSGEDATYAGNNAKLLAALEGVPLEKRSARFRCCMALVLADSDSFGVNGHPGFVSAHNEVGGKAEAKGAGTLITEGIVRGRIALASRGEGGFGYDPVFELPDLGKTFAELGIETKNTLSHRYRALVEMKELLLRLGLAREKK